MNITEKCMARQILNNFKHKNLLKDPMIDELSRSKTIEDFMIRCILKNNIHYKDVPFDFCENLTVLLGVISKHPKMLEEIKEIDSFMFVKLIYTYEDTNSLMNSNEIKKSTKRDISRLLTNKMVNKKMFEANKPQTKNI